MAGGKETPRQKMIGMMYLVLTALLAMNVSKEVVNAFVTIDEGQMKTLSAVDNKVGQQLAALASNARENETKYGPAKASADKIHQEANDLIEHINKIKAKTFAISLNGPDAEITEDIYSNGKFLVGLDSIKALVGIDNYDNNTNLMIKDAAKPAEEPAADGYNYTAVELRNRLIDYREKVISELQKIDGTETIISNVKKTFEFPTTDEVKPGEEQWIVKNFYHVPLAASTAMLTTLQSQIKSAESDLVDKLYQDVEGASYKFTKLTSAVIPQATTVSAGSSYEADVFLSAYDDQNSPEIRLGKNGARWDSVKMELIGEYDLVEMEGTKGKVKIPASGLGAQQREGVIIFKPVGLPEVIEPFKLDYSVVAPQLIVSPTKMNVFYRGLPNPVSISVPGFTDDQVRPSISTGSLTKGSDGYIVNVTSGTEANISASVELPDGSSKSMPPVKFRIKKIPDPVPSFGQKRPSDNVIPGTSVRAAQGVRAVMENFDFELKVTVASYKIVTVVNGEIREAICQGNRLNAQAKGLLDNMRRGQKFSIEEIKVNMPDGVRKVPSISLRII